MPVMATWNSSRKSRLAGGADSATMAAMKTFSVRALLLALGTSLLLTFCLRGQSASANGALDFTVLITATAAHPEPVRQFTFYVLTKSYDDITKEVEASNEIVPRDKFIEELKVSPELKAWLKAHEVLDLTAPDFDRLLTPDDIIHVPEFLLAYQRSNSGGVTNGIPKPKYVDADKKDHPERYEKMKADYLSALKKFIGSNPSTVSGVELELNGVNPQRKWAQLHIERHLKVERDAPETAQKNYLAWKVDTDLDGHAIVKGLPAGQYWLSTLNQDANAGDTWLRWDVPINVQPGQTVRVELTNLNGLRKHNAVAP